MLARNETIFKWVLYAGAAFACFLAQGMLLEHLTIWGVIPFLYPLVAAIPATYEGPASGAAFALAVGVACDLLLPGPYPCLYTLLFPLVGLCAGLLSQSVLRAGIFCSLLSAAAAFLITGTAGALLLWANGKAAWSTAALLTLKEFCVTAVLSLPLTALFHAVYHRAHRND